MSLLTNSKVLCWNLSHVIITSMSDLLSLAVQIITSCQTFSHWLFKYVGKILLKGTYHCTFLSPSPEPKWFYWEERREIVYLNTSNPLPTPSRRPPWYLMPDGLVPSKLRYCTCIWCEEKLNIPIYDWYIFLVYTRKHQVKLETLDAG